MRSLLRVYTFGSPLLVEMRVAFRADASLEIGTGHVIRCLTLADVLRERGAQCSFICRSHKGHLVSLILERGYQVLALPPLQEIAKRNPTDNIYSHWLGTDWATDAKDTDRLLKKIMAKDLLDWLVVDHYALDQEWEQALRCHARHVMVIDDLADRPHDCDLLLDQNLGRSELDYVDLITPSTFTLIGPQYALLRPEFTALRPKSMARREANSEFQHLLITMGGVDIDNATGKILDAIKARVLPSDLRITVVMGHHAPWLAQVQAQAACMPWSTRVLVGVNNMAELMTESDLAIGAAGGTSWERCCLGLPSIAVVLAENQLESAISLQRIGAAIALNTKNEIADILNPSQLAFLMPAKLRAISNAAAKVTDGRGSIRTADRMVDMCDA